MGSSARKKREKKKDFQKTKLKVGKTKPKATNFTDTSFHSRAIVLGQQSLRISAPTPGAQFAHHLSLLSSHSDTQCRESLAYLTNVVSGPSSAPQPWAAILPKLFPLMTRASASLRTQLLKLFRVIPAHDVRDHVPLFTTYLRTAMTSLAPEIRADGIEILSWLLDTAGIDLVASRDGWTKVLRCFVAVFGWDKGPMDHHSRRFGNSSSLTSSSGMMMRLSRDSKSLARPLQVFGQFLQCGIGPSSRSESMVSDECTFPFWHTEQHHLPRRADCYAYLNLFGQAHEEEDGSICEDRGDRCRVLQRIEPQVRYGLAECRLQGGEVGRAAGTVLKILNDHLDNNGGVEKDYQES
ncbi:MAG: hypothetical protein M1823_000731 [Watsoniomyces obsoletus]|nr:MAG: hypothetical protein M1823_000731 [Watsoniomyces obsoletus]